MKRIASTANMPKSEWLALRKNGISGSDAAAIAGLNPYVSAVEVYYDKISPIEEKPDNEAMRQGRDLEDYVAQRFTEETGLKVRRCGYMYRNNKYPFMIGNFDRLIVGQRAGLECKTVSPYSSDKWKDGQIPPHYQMQCQHYLAVSGFDCWYIAAIIYGKEFVYHKIERDEDLISDLSEIERRFWYENVIGQNIPDPDGTKRCSEIISNLYFKSDKEKTIELLGVDSMLSRRNELDALISKLELEKNEIDQKIKLKMQDASYANTGKFKISWVSYNQTRLDTKKLKEEQPDIYSKYAKSSNVRKFSINSAA